MIILVLIKFLISRVTHDAFFQCEVGRDLGMDLTHRSSDLCDIPPVVELGVNNVDDVHQFLMFEIDCINPDRKFFAPL